MPVYEYRCKQCGARFERRASVHEHEETKEPPCPQCGSGQTERVWSRVAVLAGGRQPSSTQGGGCGPACGPGCGNLA